MGMIHKGGNAVPFHGDHHPVGIYVGDKPIFEPIDQAQDGMTLTFENTYNDTAEATVFGESAQDGEPTPESPVPIESIKSVELVSRNADGSKSATRTIDLQGHELRSLPDGTHDELVVHRDGTVELVQRVDEYVVEKTNVAKSANGTWYAYGFTNSAILPDWYNPQKVEESKIPTGRIYSDRYGCTGNTIKNGNAYRTWNQIIICDDRFTNVDSANEILQAEKPKFLFAVNEPQTIQLPSIDPLPTYHPYTFVDGNGADISARVKVFE